MSQTKPRDALRQAHHVVYKGGRIATGDGRTSYEVDSTCEHRRAVAKKAENRQSSDFGGQICRKKYTNVFTIHEFC